MRIKDGTEVGVNRKGRIQRDIRDEGRNKTLMADSFA